MGAEPREEGRTPEATLQAQRTQALAASLRALASSAAEQAGGGVALIFVRAPEAETAQLRAAAGFAAPQAARDAATALAGPVKQSIERGQPASVPCPAALAERAGGQLVIHPIGYAERVHGALVVGSPAPLEGGRGDGIERIAADAALHLDHAVLVAEVEAMRARLTGAPDSSEDRNEEILKLSEALFAQDIELLRKDEKLGKIEKLKNDFIEKMSRELRTPLNSIIEAIISVLTGENDALSEGAKGSLRAALDDGTAFLRTLQNILDLWRIKQGELPVEVQDVNFRELVDEAIFSIQDILEGKPVTIETHLEQPFPKFRTDLTKLNQILFLILENAVKFTREGRVEILARVDDEWLVCDVRDTGIGICQDDQQFLFDEFFQVDDSSRRTYGGAGLGLTLVRDLLILLAGEVSISSEVGHGTVVSFRIPVQIVG